ncbi:hypothetical protein GCM10023190_22270 [Enteractinococcus fodinae]|uniref:Cation transport ATPase n=1 Tax=Enteractinococcus fodinae TaxID=684663 RepID=A0ABU2B317_9MICC|nr:hypothetical protein [Enteractinococcus fodinae]MDR7348017.1 cation transport ATPase [Enteractinococcus fodinae]
MTTAESPKDRAGDANHSRAQKASDEAKDVAAAGFDKTSDDKIDEIQERWEKRLAWPVLIAAILSVPAVFLTLFDEPLEMIGHILLYLTTAVLVIETTIFFLISPKKIDWVRRNWWLIGLTIATILAVIFSIGPMQLFRTVRSVGALRVLKAKQVAKAGESLANKGNKRWRRWFGQILATLVVGAFVVLALAVPESEARTTLENYVGEEGVPFAAAIAGVITVVGMYFLVRTPRKQGDSESEDRSSVSQGD